jgi:hypothetical protein
MTNFATIGDKILAQSQAASNWTLDKRVSHPVIAGL